MLSRPRRDPPKGLAARVSIPRQVVVLFLSAFALAPPVEAYRETSQRSKAFLLTGKEQLQHQTAANDDWERDTDGPGSQIQAAGKARTGKLKMLYPWYHSSSEIQLEAERLSQKCNGALSIRTLNDTGVGIHAAHVRAPGSKPSNRVFILFGEHSRELISPETGLHLLRVLCGEAVEPAGLSAASVLQDSEFELVLNGNPRSREKVEDGNFCLRTNPDGVDLNRNWDEQWNAHSQVHANAQPGPRPFSEPETRIFKQLVTEFMPTTFLTVHSGTRGLYMPWAYDMHHLASRNQPAMLEILHDIDAGHCQCPYGAAGKEVGYSCPGTCLDWVYDQLNASYSFAFEIYTNPDSDPMLKARWDQKVKSGGGALLQNGAHLGHEHFASFFELHASDFVQRHGQSLHAAAEEGDEDEDEQEECFGQFNPDTQERYNTTVGNWVQAYLELSQRVAEKLKQA